MLLTAYRDFEQRVGVVTTARGAKREMVQDAVARLPQNFKVADVERACPGTSRPTINRALGVFPNKRHFCFIGFHANPTFTRT